MPNNKNQTRSFITEHRNGQQAYEKILNIVHHQKNAN